MRWAQTRTSDADADTDAYADADADADAVKRPTSHMRTLARIGFRRSGRIGAPGRLWCIIDPQILP